MITADPTPDPLGRAVADFHRTGRRRRIKVHSSITRPDVIPVEYLFRTYDDWPAREQLALRHCRGHVLDVGAGAGAHSLALQQRGLAVTAIDTSPGAVATMQARGVQAARRQNLYDLRGETFDTVLLLMNGLGLAGTLANLTPFLAHLRSLLRPGGQILADSTDILYMFEEADGSVLLDLNGPYHGEVTYQMEYQKVQGPPFAWLFVDFGLLQDHAAAAGLRAELLDTDEAGQYLVRLA